MDFIKNNDILILQGIHRDQISTFGEFTGSNSTNIWTEISVFNKNTNVLETTNHIKFVDLRDSNYITVFPDTTQYYQYTINSGSLIIDTPSILKSFGYISGDYTVNYKFYYNLLGDSDVKNQVYIKKISPSRKELLLDYSNENLLDDFKRLNRKYFWRYGRDFRFDRFLNFGNNVFSNIVNVKNEYDESTKENRLIVKLYDKLSAQISERTSLWIVRLISEDILHDVTLLTDIVDLDLNIIRRPNFKITQKSSDATTYQNFNNLIPNVQAILDLNNVDSSEISDASVFTDYTQFSNFVKFGSSTKRLENFKQKVILLEEYDIAIASCSVNGGFAISSSNYIKSKRSEVLSGFTNYEKFLYYEVSSTSSYINTFTSSLFPGEIISAVWPKLSTDPTISLAPWSDNQSSVAYQWYATMSVVSLDYDAYNKDFLINTLPTYIQYDTETNGDYITLLSTVGEMYDYIYTYIKGLENLYVRGNDTKTDGVPNEITWNILKNIGLDLINGSDLVDIPDYKYGLQVSSSLDIKKLELAEKNITEQIWNRLLNNYMYLYKSKGTKKSIYSLLNCFGIPSDVVQVREFGGPYVSSTNKIYTQEFVDFTHVVDFNSSEYIKVPWNKSVTYTRFPDSIELKFRSVSSLPSMSLLEIVSEESPGYGVKLNVNKVNSQYGFLSLDLYTPSNGIQTITGSKFPLYDGEYYNVLIKRETASDSLLLEQNYYMNLIKYDPYTNKITINESTYVNVPSGGSPLNSCYSTSGSLYLGGYNDVRFEGSMDEFRLWNEVLEQDIFEWHSKYSTATNGNNITSSVDTLQVRLSFNYPQNLYYTSSINNDSFNTTYTDFVEAYNFSSASNYDTYPYHYSYYERYNTIEHKFIMPTAYNSNKVRIENNSLTQLIQLPDGEMVTPLRSRTYYAIKAYPLVSYENGNYRFSNNTASIEIKGDVGEYDNADVDTDRLIIGFTPTEFINNDIIAFYGLENLSNSYGDYEYTNLDNYVNDNYIKKFYFDNTKTMIDSKKYINYLKFFNKSLFETIKQFIPIKSTPIVGIVYEENLLHRNRVAILKNKTFDYTKIPTGSFDVSIESVAASGIVGPYKTAITDVSNKTKVVAKSIKLKDSPVQLEYTFTAEDKIFTTIVDAEKDFRFNYNMFSPKVIIDTENDRTISAKNVLYKTIPIQNDTSFDMDVKMNNFNISFGNVNESIFIGTKLIKHNVIIRESDNMFVVGSMQDMSAYIDFYIDIIKHRDSVITYINHLNQEVILGKMLDYKYKNTLIDRMRRDFSVKPKKYATYDKNKLDANEYNFQGYDDFFWKNTIHTSADTPDRTAVIQTWKNNPNTLRVNYSDNPKLIVD